MIFTSLWFQSAYQIFYQAEVEKIQEVEPLKQNLEVLSEAKNRWAALDEAGRKPWVDKAVADLERFKKEMSVFKHAGNAEEDSGSDEHEEEEVEDYETVEVVEGI